MVLEAPKFLVLCDLNLHIDNLDRVVLDLMAYMETMRFNQAVSGSTHAGIC